MMESSSINQHRFDRQKGLVRQDAVENLKVVVSGTGAPLTYLLLNLVLTGVGRNRGGIYLDLEDRFVTQADLTNQFLLKAEDVGEPLEESLIARLSEHDHKVSIFESNWPKPFKAYHICVPEDDAEAFIEDKADLWGYCSHASVIVSRKPLRVERKKGLLDLALASLCGSALAQELLIQSNCIRDAEIIKSWTSVNYHIRKQGIGRVYQENGDDFENHNNLIPNFQTRYGSPLRAPLGEVVDDDEVILRVPLPEGSELDRVNDDFIDIQEFKSPETRQDNILFHWSPFSQSRVEGGVLVDDVSLNTLPVENKHIFVAGVGALGSWLTPILALSLSDNTTFSLCDFDHSIEGHNLNRQVLYTDKDIGRKKVEAAGEALALLNYTHIYQPLYSKISPEVVVHAFEGSGERWSEWQGAKSGKSCGKCFSKASLTIDRSIAPASVIAGELANADVVVSCLDSLQARYYLNVVCDKLGIPMINGAAQDFRGRVHRFDSSLDDPCLVCREGTRIFNRSERASCSTDEGEVPIQSICTTSSMTASMQAVLVLLKLSGQDERAFNYLDLDARKNKATTVLSAPRDESQRNLLYENKELFS